MNAKQDRREAGHVTVKQVQCLLLYLGYDLGGVDGVMGPKTSGAVREFQRAFGGLEVDGDPGNATQQALRQAVAETFWEKPKEDPGTFWEKIPNFTRVEFRCPCPRCGGFPVEPEEGLVGLVQTVRTHFGKPVRISSGVRCQSHNDELPGSVPNSRHVAGKAVDFAVSGESGASVLDYVRRMEGVRYAYQIDSSFVHMDVA